MAVWIFFLYSPDCPKWPKSEFLYWKCVSRHICSLICVPLPPESQYNTVCLGHITNDKLACKLQYCCLLLEEWIIAQQHERWLSLKLISLCLFMALFHIIYIRMWNQAIKTICHKVCSLYFSFLFDYEHCQQYPFLVDE